MQRTGGAGSAAELSRWCWKIHSARTVAESLAEHRRILFIFILVGNVLLIIMSIMGVDQMVSGVHTNRSVGV